LHSAERYKCPDVLDVAPGQWVGQLDVTLSQLVLRKKKVAQSILQMTVKVHTVVPDSADQSPHNPSSTLETRV
jgi:hypothetical protein